ncbi:MAG: hypothetical protein R6V31_06320 [Halohasta sp.]
MSGEEPDDEGSVWDEIEEFTSAEPTDEAESIVDAEVVDSDGQSSSGSRAAPGDSEERSSAGSRPEFGDAEPVAHEEPHADREPLAENATRESHTDRDSDPQTGEPSVDDIAATAAEEAPDADEVFDEMEVSAVDGEALWDELASGGTAADAGATAEPTAAEPSVEQPETGSIGGGQPAGSPGVGEEGTLVDKRQYCQQCPYFTEPPEVGCTHPGTTIVEVVEDGRFRVRDCPVVTETGPDRTILDGGD